MSQPIRILQVVTHMERGGLETMLMNYYRHMDRKQVQFDFLVHRGTRAAYDDEIEALGGQIYRLPRLVPWSKSYLLALDSFFKSHPEYQIVHVHQDCLSSVILKIALKNGVPVRIAHSHSSSQDKDLKYPFKLWYRRQIPRYATHLFACGQKAGNWMFGGKSYTTINNAIDIGLYQYDEACALNIRRSLDIPDDAFVVGHVGRFSYPKNHNFLIDIFYEVFISNPKSQLLLVGDGDLKTKIEEKVASLGISANVIFTGIRTDVPQLLQAMDVFVFPSIYEGFPVTMIEAQASGLSCCISENISTECVLTDEVARFSLHETADIWAKWILSRHKIPRKSVSEQMQRSGFDISRNAKMLQEFYLEKYDIQSNA